MILFELITVRTFREPLKKSSDNLTRKLVFDQCKKRCLKIFVRGKNNKYFSSACQGIIEDIVLCLETSIRNSLLSLWEVARRMVTHFNLFKHAYTDDYGRQSELMTTRVFIILITMSITILTFYTSLIEHTQTVQAKSPSYNTYRRLVATYNATLTCPCTRITAAYSKFISLQPVSHSNDS